MKRAGFTMIELIFVIVILGILAAVAIPKLAATRSDAEASKIISNLATCVGDGGGAYLKDGNFSNIDSTNMGTGWTVATLKAPISVACQDALDCFTIISNDANGTMTVAALTSGTGTTKKCVQAQALAVTNDLIRTNQF